MSNATKPNVIVAGFDYSESSELALDRAIQIAGSQEGVELHVVNVVSLVPPYELEGLAPVTPSPGVSLEDARGALERHLAAKLAPLQADGAARIPRIVGHVRVGAPSEELAQLAADLESDLVVVGTHGRRGAARLLLGSVAEGAVRLAPCPVLVVRPKRIVSVPAIAPACSECVKTRKETKGERLWCDQHSERHGQRHTYHQGDRISRDSTMPLVFHG